MYYQIEDEQEKLFKINDSLNDLPCKCANTCVGDYTFAYKQISSELMKQPVVFAESHSKPKTQRQVYQFYAELEGYKPKIWRRFIISPDATFENLAYALMAMFNMEGSHLYRFDISRKEENIKSISNLNLSKTQILSRIPEVTIEHYVDEEMNRMDDIFFLNELGQLPPKRFTSYDTKIKKLLEKEKSSLSFVYDFGDDWAIKLTLEKVDVETDLTSAKLPNVLNGKGLGIIEDCGGVGGLECLQNAFEKKSGEEYEELSTWLGTKEIDLDSFDIKRCNAIIKSKMRVFEENYWE